MKKEPVLKFPCKFPIKAICLHDKRSKPAILSIVRNYAPELNESALKINKSKNKKYLAYTVEITAVSQEQLDKIYQALNDCEFVVMTL